MKPKFTPNPVFNVNGAIFLHSLNNLVPDDYRSNNKNGIYIPTTLEWICSFDGQFMLQVDLIVSYQFNSCKVYVADNDDTAWEIEFSDGTPEENYQAAREFYLRLPSVIDAEWIDSIKWTDTN